MAKETQGCLRTEEFVKMGYDRVRPEQMKAIETFISGIECRSYMSDLKEAISNCSNIHNITMKYFLIMV